MGRFRQSLVSDGETVTAATLITKDLPVNPLSHLLITLNMAQNLANTQMVLANMLAVFSKIEVLASGSPVVSLSGADLSALNMLMHDFSPSRQNSNGADNELVTWTWLVPFGRKLFNPEECYPETKRGELQLQLTPAAAFTNIDTTTVFVEAVELLGAEPKNYLRATTKNYTPAATGEGDVPLPIGHPLAGILLFGTTIPSGNTATTTIDKLALIADNASEVFVGNRFETLRGQIGCRCRPHLEHGSHIHQIDGAAFAQYMDSSASKYNNDCVSNYLFLDFDPNRDGAWLLDTAEMNSLNLRITAGDTNAVRVVPVEQIAV